MPTARIATATGPIELYYEETGQGFPLIWCHEFGGDYRSWEPQVRYFSRRYRVLFNQHVAEFLAAVESGRWGTWKPAGR